MKWLIKSKTTGCYAQTAMHVSEIGTWVFEQKHALRFPDPSDARAWIKRFYKEYPSSPATIGIVRVAK